MNSPAALKRWVFAIGLVVAIGILAVYFIPPKRASSRREAGASASELNTGDSIAASDRRHNASQAFNGARPRLELPGATIAEFLQRSGNGTPALIAVYSYTKDSQYRSALEERSLTDPEAGIALVVFGYLENRWERKFDDAENGKQQLDLMQKLHGSFPNDVIVAGLLAGTQAVLGRHAEALSALGDNSHRKSIRDGSVARQQAMRQLMLAGGLNEEGAWSAASLAEDEYLFAISSIINPLSKSLRQLNGLPVDTRVEVASRMASLSRALNPYQDVSGFNAIVGRSLEALALRAVPLETEYSKGGATVADRLAALKNEDQRDRSLQKKVEVLFRTADAKTIQGFHQQREQFGHPIAVQWMEQQVAKGK